jgi:nitrile hydratase subunit alpha
VLREFGLELAASTKIVVSDSTADHRYMVIPMRPAGTDGWSEEQLMALITRDALLGVAIIADQQ